MDNTAAVLLDILKYTIPAFIVLVSTSLIVNKFLVTQTQRKQLSLFHEAQDVTLRLRLQAYERLVLFVERIGPRQLLPRVYDSGMTVMELRTAMTYNILGEFEHNMTQQIYVSKNVWETVKNVKEQEISMANQIAGKLDPNAPAKELYKLIMDYVLQADAQTPTEVALTVINEEVKKLMAYGSY